MATSTLGIRQSVPASWQPLDNAGSNMVAVGAIGPFVAPAGLDGFVTRIGARLRRTTTAPTVQFALYEAQADNAPGALLGRTGLLGVASNAADGQYVEGAVTWGSTTRTAGTDTGLRLPVRRSGQRFLLAVRVHAGAIEVGRSADYPETTWHKRASANPPVDPFGATSSFSARPAVLYCEVEEGVAPALTLTGPASVVSTPTPLLTADFNDADVAAYGDRIAAYAVRVRVVGATGYHWTGQQAASADEQAAGQILHRYAGTALATDVPYEWQAEAEDRTGRSSGPTAWSAFAFSGSGNVDTANATPTGKQESGIVASWSARWTHPGALAMDQARLRLYDGAGRIVADSPAIALSPAVANNAVFSLTAAQVGFATNAAPLSPGAYQYELVGRDTGATWSAFDGPLRPFSVNSPPTIPSGLSPQSGTVLSYLPRLDFVLSDPDPDDSLGAGVVGYVEVTRPNGAVFEYGPIADVDPITGAMFLQTTSDHLPNGMYGTYRWRARGLDVSAGAYSPDWSTPATFIFQPAPEATITVPGGTATTTRPTVGWTVAFGPQTAYQVDWFRAGGNVTFFSSGRVNASGSAGSYQIPEGWLHNKRDYDYELTVWGGSGLASATKRRRVAIDTPKPASSTGVTASLVAKRRDWEASTPLISWERTSLPASRFGGYVIYHRFADQEFADAVPIARQRPVGATSFVHHDSWPNAQIIYSVTELEDANGDIRESGPVDVLVETVLTVPTLTALNDPGNDHAALMHLNGDLGGGFKRPKALYDTWGTGGAPTVIQAPRGYGQATVSLSLTVVGHQRMGRFWPMRDLFDDVWGVLTATGVLVYRGEDGTRLYGVVDGDPSWSQGDVVGTRTVSVSLAAVAYDETVTVPG